jgi:hypothetical protein
VKQPLCRSLRPLIDDLVYERFDARNIVFARAKWDTKAPFYGKGIYSEADEIISRDIEGYSRDEFERSRAAWAVHELLRSRFGERWEVDQSQGETTRPSSLSKQVSPGEMSQRVKEAGRYYGAALTGITERDDRWLYTHQRDGSVIDFDPDLRYVIVMATAMDPALIRQSPAYDSATAVGVGYSRMAFLVSTMAEMISNLGYRAVPMANDTALSIPLAIQAGLGRLGRNGMLLAPSHGACLRLCKVLTDLPLEPDNASEPALNDSCRSCTICAATCPARAISDQKEPSYETATVSNNRGVLRWPVDPELCYGFWVKNGNDCSNCIAHCPMTPPDVSRMI